MKILYYSPHPQLRLDAPTGYGTHMREMIAAWRKAGHEVQTLIAGDGEVSASGGAEQKGRFRSFKRFIPKMIWETLRDLAIMRFDRQQAKALEAKILSFAPVMVYERVAYLQDSGAMVCARFEVRHIAEVNAPYPQERVAFSGNSFLLGRAKEAERSIFGKADAVSVVSSALKDHFTALYPFAERRIHVVPNAVNPAYLDIKEGEPDALREQYGFGGSLVIGFVGSIFPYHGVDLLIRAFADLGGSGNAKLLIVGGGSILPDLKALAQSLKVLPHIVFTESIPFREVYPHIAAMDICCMPKTNWYCSPIKVFEYALLTKPVIAPDVVPMHDVMAGDEGILVYPTVESLKAALAQLIEDKALRDRIAKNWNTKVLREFTWDAAAQKTLDLCT